VNLQEIRSLINREARFRHPDPSAVSAVLSRRLLATHHQDQASWAAIAATNVVCIS